MTVEKCYEIMKGDYKDALSRLSTDEKIKKALLKLLSDKSFVQLCNAFEKGNFEEACNAANTLKGLSKNLSISGLTYSSGNLVEALRGRKSHDDELEVLYKRMKKDYALTMACIQML